MDKRGVEFFRSMLNQRLGELLNQADQAINELLSQTGQEIEDIDQASDYINLSLKLKIRTRESRLIKKIRDALERMDHQMYGICEICGEDISIKRLEARPVTTKCIECKEEEERLEYATQ